MTSALSSDGQDVQIFGPLPSAQKVAGHTPESEIQPADVKPEMQNRALFPVTIRHVAGRGRGFFAARDIQAGETVFQAVPLAWAISEDWMKNTCWWCFAYNARRGHSIKAMDASTPSSSSKACSEQSSRMQSRAITNGRPRQSSARYKGVFCSTDCHRVAIAAHGGQEKWDSYLALLVGMEDEIQLHGSKMARSSKARAKLESCSSTLLDASAAMELQPTLPSESDEKHVASHCLDADFDPDDLTDDQFVEWISMTWDTIAEHGLFSDYMPDSSQRELIRLIANQLCLCEALTADQGNDVPAADWQTEMVASSAASRDIAPLEALDHVKSNEVEVLRASLRLMQLAPPPLDGCASAPATIAPIRLPWQPSPAQIA
ncbi:hypothetical protein IWW47_004624, partial [Coemansia sp. RSA 2052]